METIRLKAKKNEGISEVIAREHLKRFGRLPYYPITKEETEKRFDMVSYEVQKGKKKIIERVII